jgi:hypothetical protein
MPKKTKPRRSSPSLKHASGRTPILTHLVRGFLRLFVEELPVTELRVAGKPSIEIAELKTPDHQAALEALCGGRSFKAQKQLVGAIITPEANNTVWRVTIEGKSVGQLKPADAKFLAKQLAKAELGPCAVKVSALIEGGRRKKNGDEENFFVKVTLPPRPQKKPAALAAPPPEEEALEVKPEPAPEAAAESTRGEATKRKKPKQK